MLEQVRLAHVDLQKPISPPRNTEISAVQDCPAGTRLINPTATLSLPIDETYTGVSI